MNATASIAGFRWRIAGAAGLVAVLALGSGAALAQQKKGEPAKSAAPAPAAAAPAQGDQSAWVKLCEKAPVLAKAKDGKDERVEKNICLTHHERLDGNTGMVLVSAAIRDVEGQDKKHLMVMVPLGMAIQPGLRAKIYDKAMWEKAQKNEKVDDAKLEAIKLNFSLCHPAGCTAEIDLTPAIVYQLKAGAGVMVFSINANGQVIAFPVPLSGFAQALAGGPIDNAKYSEARKGLMKQIAMRQQQLIEEYKKNQEKGAPAGGAAAAAPAPAPAPKK
ncbi:MAG: invasion associated locus B family protein [Hyphomicrobiaceae bacterium]|nr:invasion associated locus B family protein [Hyphomicrobiaceae bacterium]